MKKTIAVIFGGRSPEYHVSLQSAAAVIRNINTEKYRVVMTGIDSLGNWHVFEGSTEEIEKDTWKDSSALKPAVLSLDHEGTHCLLTFGEEGQDMIPIDAAFPVMHGAYGEDGRLQGALEMAGIPVIGCGMMSSALCMDKLLAHHIASSCGIPCAEGTCVNRYDENTRKAAEAIGYPLYVKPLRAGSSYGISRVCSSEELEEAVRNALRYDSTVIMEEEIRGFETGCAVIEKDGLFMGRPDRIILQDAYYDYTEKYNPKNSEIQCPAPFDAELSERIRKAAEAVWHALGCTGFARIDLFVSEEGKIYFNEVNTIPGFTAHSRFPKMMEAAGISFPELIDLIIEERLKKEGETA